MAPPAKHDLCVVFAISFCLSRRRLKKAKEAMMLLLLFSSVGFATTEEIEKDDFAGTFFLPPSEERKKREGERGLRCYSSSFFRCPSIVRFILPSFLLSLPFSVSVSSTASIVILRSSYIGSEEEGMRSLPFLRRSTIIFLSRSGCM